VIERVELSAAASRDANGLAKIVLKLAGVCTCPG